MEGPLNSIGKPNIFISYTELCTSFCIEVPKFPRFRRSNILYPLQEYQVRQIAFRVEHLMTIMQAQLADKNEDEKIEFIMMIGEQYINQIKSMDKYCQMVI